MNNPRISAKERNLLKGAIRRVFSRSELRRAVIKKAIISHSDPKRPKVKTWCRCAICKQPEAISYMQVDHVDPIVPISKTLEKMEWTEVIDRTWCDENNLQAVDKVCHKKKSKLEREERKKERAKNGYQVTKKTAKKCRARSYARNSKKRAGRRNKKKCFR